jgi:hypothetical protein
VTGLLESMARHYAELRLDEEASELHRAEVVVWDATIDDGSSASAISVDQLKAALVECTS